ncbi:MAG: glycosyltransferase [PVC group bacterium]|nr:glycosyltransferase [PVC group bacterium]
MISIVIPSYNSEQTIGKCIDSLKNQSYENEYEIILVDSSDDNTPNIVRQEYPDTKLTHLEEKTDPGTARNLGIEKAKGEIIAFIDSDCIASYDWLKNIETAYDQGYNVVGGAVDIANEESDLIGWAGYIAEFREFLPGAPRHEAVHIPTCNISYKKDIFEKFGFFDGKYYPQEDLVFNYNLRQKGEKIIFSPDIQVRHLHRSNLKEFFVHQRKIGEITAKVMKVVNLEGSFIARNSLLGLLLVPLLAVVKFIRTGIVFLRYQPQVITKRPLVLVLFAMGLVYWGIGFAIGIYKKS